MTHSRPIEQLHIPVLVNECLDMLAPAFEGTEQSQPPLLIDGTLGMGGHTQAALERFPTLRVIGIDRDPEAITLASERLAPYGDRFCAVHTTYDNIATVARALNVQAVDGILLDLGVSSFQLDQEERGFSYSHDSPLDMRMDTSSSMTAARLLAEENEREIARILRIYGEEKFASRIAKNIVTQRATTPIERSGQLVDIIKSSIPAPARRTGGNPAKRTFQALRVAVNDELRILERAVPAAISTLKIGGRIVVESYQSLEDRIVKEVFRSGAVSHAPEGLPFIPKNLSPRLKLLTRGAARADLQEITRNSRAKPVRLRGAELIREWEDVQ